MDDGCEEPAVLIIVRTGEHCVKLKVLPGPIGPSGHDTRHPQYCALSVSGVLPRRRPHSSLPTQATQLYIIGHSARDT
jgi:hypothetical protein